MQSNIFQTNTFIKGMNLDTDITMLDPTQYRYAENVRVVTDNASTTGILQNIQSVGDIETNGYFQQDDAVLFCTTIKDYIIVLTVDSQGINTIYRIDNYNNPPLEFHTVVRGNLGYTKDDKVKIVANYETTKVCNIYIACEGKMIKSCNILSDKYVYSEDNPYVDQYGNILDPSSMDMIPSAVLSPLHIVELTSGSLNSGKVQYAYQLFNDNGNASMISTVSELVSLGLSDQPTSVGNVMFSIGQHQGSDADVNSGKGVRLSLTFDSGNDSNSNFDSIRIFRIHYSSNTDAPTIDIIIETGINPSLTTYTFVDSGQAPETSYTAEEFNSLITVFNAATIEKHQNRLFAANVEDQTFDVEYDARAYRCDSKGFIVLTDSNSSRDIRQQLPTEESALESFYSSIPEDHDCINPYNSLGGNTFTPTDGVDNMQYSNIQEYGQRLLGGSGPNVSYTFVYHDLILDQYTFGSPISNAASTWYCDITSTDQAYFGDMKDLQTGNTWDEKYYLQGRNDAYTYLLNNYSNPVMEGYMLGYMRDEIYRFGIIFYNEKSQASPVHWIGDIRMPYGGDYIPFHIDGKYLYGRALGLRFEVNNVPEGVTRYEIVRCDRTEADRTVVMQAVVGNTVHLVNYDDEVGNMLIGDTTAYPRIPFSNVEDCSIAWYEEGGGIDGRNNYLEQDLINPLNKIFISPEIDLTGESSINNLNDCYIEHLYSSAPMANSDSSTLNTYTRKYFSTPQQTVHAFTLNRQDYNVGHFQLRNNGEGGVTSTPNQIVASLPNNDSSRDLIGVAVGKRYLMYHNYDEAKPNTRTDVRLNGNLSYPPVLEQGALADISAYYRNCGTKRYVNYAFMNTDPGQGGRLDIFDNPDQDIQNDYGNCKRGFFGSCLVGEVATDLYDSSVVTLNQVRNCTNGIVSEVDRQNFNPFVNSVVNFKRITVPYSGNNYSARQNSTYISTAASNTKDNSVTYVFGGDTYLGVHDHLTSMSFPDQRSGDNGDILSEDTRIQSFFVDYFPVETTINLNKMFGQNTSYSVEDRRNYVDPYLHNTITGGTVGDYHTQTRPYYAYNDAYSAGSTTKLYTAVDDDTELNQLMSNRIRSSMAKTSGEKSDSWTRFQQADYLDVDSQYGSITNLRSFNNKLFYFQEDALGVAAVNERSLITDNNLTELTLGTGGILTRFDYVTTANGDGIVNDPSITDSRLALYWLDDNKNEICQYSNGVQKLSKTKNVQSYLNDNPNAICHDGLYDAKYNEVQFCFDDKVLVFNEQIDAFSSFYTFNPDKHAEFSDRLLYLKDNTFGYEYPYVDNLMTCNIKFIINKDVLYTKVFDNVFFGGVFDDIYYSLQNVKFNTKSQQATILKNSITDTYAIDYREDTYRFAIGREEESNDTMSYPGRLRGKYMICDYTIKCDNQHNFNLPYVNTTYRRSLV